MAIGENGDSLPIVPESGERDKHDRQMRWSPQVMATSAREMALGFTKDELVACFKGKDD
jgi:hypothetical protein